MLNRLFMVKSTYQRSGKVEICKRFFFKQLDFGRFITGLIINALNNVVTVSFRHHIIQQYYPVTI